MAQTKRKRSTKHRGNAAGSVTARGRTGRPPTGEEKKARAQTTKSEARAERLNRKPTWKGMMQRAAFASVIMFALLLFATKGQSVLVAVAFAVAAFCLYTPLGFYLETWMWRRRMAKQGKPIT